MSLTFDYHDEEGDYTCIESFPYQTKTALTFSVLNTDNKSIQCLMIEKDMIKRGFDIETRKKIMLQIRTKLQNKNCVLGMI